MATSKSIAATEAIPPYLLYSFTYTKTCFVDEDICKKYDAKVLQGYFQTNTGETVTTLIATKNFYTM